MMMLESVLAERLCSKANATCVAHPSVGSYVLIHVECSYSATELPGKL